MSRSDLMRFSSFSFRASNCLTERFFWALSPSPDCTVLMVATILATSRWLNAASNSGAGRMKPNEECAMTTASQSPVAILARNLRRFARSKSFLLAVSTLAPGYRR
ncbi:hypothetical protein D3C87_1448000 [compost metagenome]